MRIKVLREEAELACKNYKQAYEQLDAQEGSESRDYLQLAGNLAHEDQINLKWVEVEPHALDFMDIWMCQP